jgi:hypothetical protein
MPAQVWFWLLFVMAVVAFFVIGYSMPEGPRRQAGLWAIVFALIALLAIATIGWPIK